MWVDFRPETCSSLPANTSGKSMMSKAPCNMCIFRSLSSGVLAVKEGDALTF